jgi:hypothetical protein
MFQHLLDNHPQIACGGEIFGKEKTPISNPNAVFAGLVRRVCKKRSVAWCGFRLFGRHVSYHHLEQWVGEFPVVFLHRNPFNRYLSEQLVAENIRWKHQVYRKPVWLDPKQIVKRLTQEEVLAQKIKSHLKNYVEIDYEHTLAGYFKCLEFLGVDQIDPVFSTERQRVVPHWRLISNYREVVSALRNTKWEKHLREELI